MATIIVGVFPGRDQAERAVSELRDRGFSSDAIGIAIPRQETRAAAGGPPSIPSALEWVPNQQSLTAADVGPITIGGSLSACAVRAPGESGSLRVADLMACLGIEPQHASWYDQQVRRGYSLVTVRTDTRAAEAQSILEQAGSIEVPGTERTPSAIEAPPRASSAAEQPVIWSALESVEPGWAILGSDGRQIGKVDEVGPNYLLMKKGFLFPRELYIPFSAVERVLPGVISLAVTSEQIDQEHWERPPAATAGAVPAIDLGRARQGLDVYTSDGQRIGVVQEAATNCAHVLCCSHLFVPPERVSELTDDRLVLTVSRADLDKYDWTTCHPTHQAEYAPGGPGAVGIPPQEHEGGVALPIEAPEKPRTE